MAKENYFIITYFYNEKKALYKESITSPKKSFETLVLQI